MLINQTDVIATQLQQIAYPYINAITETGVPITITTNQKQRDDPALLAEHQRYPESSFMGTRFKEVP